MQKNTLNLETYLSQIESHLRLGERVLARQKIDQVIDTNVKVSRSLTPKWAELLRRSGRPELALKFLFKYVRRKGHSRKIATPLEQEEYAASLIALKATEEAIALLSTLTESNSSKTFLFLAMAHINRWDYVEAQRELEHFISLKNVTPYDRFIGITNLMASKVANVSTYSKALEEEINHYLEEAQKQNFKVLYANLLEIKSQLIVKSVTSNIVSKTILNKAWSYINDPNAKENLFIKKWELLSRKNSGKKWRNEWQGLALMAKKMNHVETLRDCDFHLGEFDSEFAFKVFFGTPYESFRKKILDTYDLEMPAAYWLDINPESLNKKFEFDYLKYKDLKVGSVIFKVLQALSFDFYKKQNMYTLFEVIFPNDYFNPDSSVNKIHQAIKRARDWLKKKKIPLFITQENEEYFFTGDVEIKIYLKDRIRSVEKRREESLFHELDILKNYFKDEVFNLQEASKNLKHSNLRKTQRLIKRALEQNIIVRMNQGKNTTYQFIDS